jgi:hypothetical protein
MAMKSTLTSMMVARQSWDTAGIRPLAQVHKAGFPLAMHGAVGCVLHGMRNTLVTASVFVGNTYGTAAMGRLDKPARALDRVRCRLDSCVFQEYPTLPRAANVYYPGHPAVAPALPMTSLEGVCQYLAASGVALRHIADLLFAHYPVTLGDRVLRIADDLEYQANELPYVIGPPKRRPPAAPDKR